MAENEMYRATNSNVVYYERDGQRHWVLDPETVESLGGWGPVQLRPPGQVNGIQAGDTWPSVISGNTVRDGYPLSSDASPEIDVVVQGRRCTNWVVGFTGGVAAEFIDKDQRVLGATEVQAYGVDALGVFWNSHDRVDRWTWPVPDGTTAIRVYHKWAPRDRWAEDMAAFHQLIDVIAKTYTTVAEFLAANEGAGDYSTQSEG